MGAASESFRKILLKSPALTLRLTDLYSASYLHPNRKIGGIRQRTWVKLLRLGMSRAGLEPATPCLKVTQWVLPEATLSRT